MIHELDQTRHTLDRKDFFTTEIDARLIADCLQYWMQKNSMTLPSRSHYLGLAAGGAVGERALARYMGIAEEDMTLVDKGFQNNARIDFQEHYPKMDIIHSGLFTYLSHPQEKQYTLVSIFGIEYRLGYRETKTLLTLLPPHLEKGAFVVVAPILGNNPDTLWQEHGFTPIRYGLVYWDK